MARDAKKMRDELFETLFIGDGITLADLMIQLSPFIKAWDELYNLFEKYVPTFDFSDQIEKAKIIDNKYLVIKHFTDWGYLIVDIVNKKVLDKKDVIKIFEEQFFIDNFDQDKTNWGTHYSDSYYFFKFNGNVERLIELCVNNREIYEAPNNIIYKNSIGEDYIFLNIILINGNILIGFRSPNQFLYEHLHIKQDLTPAGMQGAVERIGAERMREMFSKVKDIKVPIRCIPSGILKMLNIKCGIDEKSKEKTISLVKEKSQN